MKVKMKIVWVVLNTTLVALLLGVLLWLANRPGTGSGGSSAATSPANSGRMALRIGLIPERDIFEQRKRYQALADYLSGRMDRPVQLVTLNTYEAVLLDFAEKKVHGAFLGSLVAVLAMDRLGAQVVVRPELPGQVSTYHGVIFVRADSPIRTLEQLSGHTIGMVRTTTAGHVFPGCVIMRLKLWDGPNRPHIVWVGTHDDVAVKVMEGRVDVGAMKNLRLDALMRSHPEWKIRRLARGRSVPNNALLMRRDVDEKLAARLSQILLKMDSEPQGRETLAAMGVARFVPCRAEEYAAVYDMTECILPLWKQIGVPGPAPRRPDNWPEPDPIEVRRCYDVNY